MSEFNSVKHVNVCFNSKRSSISFTATVFICRVPRRAGHSMEFQSVIHENLLIFVEYLVIASLKQ